MGNRYGIYTASLFGGSTLTFNQIHGQDISPNLQIEEHIVAGAVDRAVNVIMSGGPEVPLRTHDLAGACGISATAGFKATTGARFRMQKKDPQGTFASGSSHVFVDSTLGFGVLQSIAAQQGQLAEAIIRYMALFDGSNPPLTASVSQSLSGVTAPAANGLYTLGPLKIGSTFFTDLQGASFSTGIELEPKSGDGYPYPTNCFIKSRKPRLTLSAIDPELLDTIGSALHAQLGVTIKQYWRKKATGQTGLVADDQTSHICLTISAGSWGPSSVSGSGGDNVSNPIEIIPTGTISLASGVAIA